MRVPGLQRFSRGNPSSRDARRINAGLVRATAGRVPPAVAVLAAGALALSGCANETPPEQPGAHTRAVLEDVFATTSQTGFGETFLDRLSDDVTFTATGTSPVAGQYHGKTEYREKVLSRLHDHLATPMRPQLDQMIVDGDWAAVCFHAEGVHGTNGSDASMQYCWVMRVAGDQIVDVIGYYDTAKMAGLFV